MRSHDSLGFDEHKHKYFYMGIRVLMSIWCLITEAKTEDGCWNRSMGT